MKQIVVDHCELNIHPDLHEIGLSCLRPFKNDILLSTERKQLLFRIIFDFFFCYKVGRKKDFFRSISVGFNKYIYIYIIILLLFYYYYYLFIYYYYYLFLLLFFIIFFYFYYYYFYYYY